MITAIIPVAIVALAVGSYMRRPKNRGVMTPERTKIYGAAISGALKDPAKLDKLASAFAGEGLPEQAKLLSQRAALRRLPVATKQARRQVWRQAMKSTNRGAVLDIATAYDSQGCTVAAMRLREYASGIPDTIPEPAEETSTPEPEAAMAPAPEPEPEPEVIVPSTPEPEPEPT